MFEVAAQLALTAVFMVTLAYKVVDGLFVPLFDKYEWDKFFLKYVSWVLAGVVIFQANINFFVEIAPDLNYTAGLIFSSIIAGGGANIMNDFLDRG